MTDKIWSEVLGTGPIVALALHAGHDARAEVRDLFDLDEDERLREEDPFTDRWTSVVPTRIVALRSRFEVDLNRPRERAVYLTPVDAWGLEVWRQPPDSGLLVRSLAQYDLFYANLHRVLESVERRHGRFVVLDLHSYNHRREGPDGPAASTMLNPQVNVGTGTMHRARWAHVVERFMDDLRGFPYPGGALDVRENVRFRGGNLAAWVHANFPETGCVLSVEVKKFFMDEWSGRLDGSHVESVRDALASTIPGLETSLAALVA